jgi:hypothetical protein
MFVDMKTTCTFASQNYLQLATLIATNLLIRC